MEGPPVTISAVDLFCGAGGLSYGLAQAGVKVMAGVDLDPSCKYPFESNIDAAFLEMDVADLTADHLDRLWAGAEIRLLAGCAPCQPFSPYRRGADTSKEKSWPLLHEFAGLIEASRPELVTMENVPRLGKSPVFADFVKTLESEGYYTAWRSCRCVDYGLPQSRRRLVLVASLFGPVDLPEGPRHGKAPATVGETIKELPEIVGGQAHPDDPLHLSRSLSEINMQRIRASRPGGTWADWPEHLIAPCHRKESGSTFKNVYARMEWDKPAPTITTLAHSFGTGRFGHPDQDRPISLREAAMLQGFPRDYRFVRPGDSVKLGPLGRLIGNAVPPPIGRVVGEALLSHATERAQEERG